MDPKQQQVVYHDWESDHYDDKWSISFDDRCIDYAAGRFRKAAPDAGRFDKVLEIGCGTGFFLLNLAQAGFVGEAHCTDISAGMVRVCTANGRRLGIDVHGQVADAEALGYDDATFDLVIGHAVVHHLPDLPAAFAEFARVLKPGGRLVIAGEPSRYGDAIASHVKRAARIGVRLAAVVAGADRVYASPRTGGPSGPEAGDRSGGARTHADHAAAALEAHVDLHTFHPEELEALARDAGFTDVRSVTEELTANWFGWATRTIEGLVGTDRIPAAYKWASYRTWRRLYAFDELVAARAVPKRFFYNCIVTGVAPG